MHNPRPLKPWNPVDQFCLLGWVLLQPERLAPYRADLLRSSTLRTGRHMACTLAFLPLLLPVLAIQLGLLPRPPRLSAGFVPVACAWLAAGWLATAWGPVDEKPVRATQDVAYNVKFFVAGGVGLSAVLIGTVIYFFWVAGSSPFVAVLLAVAFYTAAIVTSSIATIVALDSSGVEAPHMMEVIATLGLPVWLATVGAGYIPDTAPDWASVVLFFGLFVLCGVGLQGIFRLNKSLERMLEATHRPGAFTLLVAAFGLSYIVITWMSLLGGWQLLSK